MVMDGLCEDDLAELSLLRALEIDELVSSGHLADDQRFDDNLLSRLPFTYPEIRLDLFTGATYPAEQLSFDIENLSLPRLDFDYLRIELRKIISADAVANDYEKWRQREEGDTFEPEMTALHLVQKTVDFLKTFRNPEEQASLPEEQQYSLHWNCKNDIIPLPGTDLTQLNLKAFLSELLGKSLQQICGDIPGNFRVLHVESVLRNDIYSNFLMAKTRIRLRINNNFSVDELRKIIPLKRHDRQRFSKSDMIDYLVTPKVTFHGTSNHLVPNIVRHGFMRPGEWNPATGMPLPVRCGSTYGRGIYSSPSAEFSLSYSGSDARPTTPNGFWGLKLIVCATIMGVTADVSRADNWRNMLTPFPNADSHVANRELEYIVFDRTQILPCYVIHMDWGNDNREHFSHLPQNCNNWEPQIHPKLRIEVFAPGDKQRVKEELAAKAAKYFPYGYGPATGTSFVVEEVGEVDDDEEEYGDYQKARLDGANAGGITVWGSGVYNSGDGKNEKDEYTDAVREKGKIRKVEMFDEEDTR